MYCKLLSRLLNSILVATLFLRDMAREVGLNRSRVQQLLTSEPAQGVSTQANGAVRQAGEEVTLRDRLAHKASLVRQAVGWF